MPCYYHPSGHIRLTTTLPVLCPEDTPTSPLHYLYHVPWTHPPHHYTACTMSPGHTHLTTTLPVPCPQDTPTSPLHCLYHVLKTPPPPPPPPPPLTTVPCPPNTHFTTTLHSRLSSTALAPPRVPPPDLRRPQRVLRHEKLWNYVTWPAWENWNVFRFNWCLYSN